MYRTYSIVAMIVAVKTRNPGRVGPHMDCGLCGLDLTEISYRTVLRTTASIQSDKAAQFIHFTLPLLLISYGASRLRPL